MRAHGSLGFPYTMISSDW